MKILITGGSGLLGQYLNVLLSVKHNLLTLYNSHPGNCTQFNNFKVDITDHKFLKEIFNQFNPDVVIHTAAVSTPAQADKLTSKYVFDVNVNSTNHIAELCDVYGSKLIYTSTDLVYAGYRGSMLDENAKLIPASLYAETKLVGEQKIKETFNNYIILRTALLFGFGMNHSTNHFHKMYESLKAGKEEKLFYDQFRTPLSLFEAAKIINELIELDVPTETINFACKERLSRLEIGERLCDAAGFDKNLLIKTSMYDSGDNQQVADVSMNTNKLQSFGIKLRSFDESLAEILKTTPA
ncbi:MAG: NAD(P)-dependent oxidoreductase [Ignavibacteriales bacterium]|nr:MAG: NAD(P)-dependent oxidoreductase [Ignavibacteriales bacterium]